MSPGYILTLLLHFICFGFFFFQLSNLMSNYLDPGPDRLHTVLENKNLSQANISLVFKVCYTPSYNKTVLQEAGYSSGVLAYFMGTNRSRSRDFIGWAGENKNLDIAGRYQNETKFVCEIFSHCRSF